MNSEKTLPRFRVYVSVPTVYQSNSARFFGLTSRERDGLTRYDYFDTEDDAKEHLNTVVDNYHHQYGTDEEAEEMKDQIESGYLEYDAAVAYIQEAFYQDDATEPNDAEWS